jgi:hypothetical protein
MLAGSARTVLWLLEWLASLECLAPFLDIVYVYRLA